MRMLMRYTLAGAALGVVAEVIQEKRLGAVTRSSSLEITSRPTGAPGVGVEIGL